MVLRKYYVISYKRQEHLRISLSAGVLNQPSMGIRGQLYLHKLKRKEVTQYRV